MMVVDPRTKSDSHLPPADPHPVQAATVDSNSLYLLSTSGTVLKTDLVGNVLSTYRFRFGSGFRPTSLGVTGNSLYLIDRAGHTQRFRIP